MPRPSNLHAHFRWGPLMKAITPQIIRPYRYVLGMPNNGPENGMILTPEGADEVFDAIVDIRAAEGITTFQYPLMTVYHTDLVTPQMLEVISDHATVWAVKDYPSHKKDQEGTTGSGQGVPFDERPDDVIRAFIDNKVLFTIHAQDVNDKNGRELPHPERSRYCITGRLRRFREKWPDLELRIEHADVKEAIELVREDTSGKTTATITPHHMLFNEHDLRQKSWRNLLRCMPYVNTEDDRLAVVDAAISGDSRFIAGDDTAAHEWSKKNVPFEQAACGCWMPHSVALYVIAFMQADALDDRFVRFMCYNGLDYWGLSRPSDDDTISIVEEDIHDLPAPTPVPELNDVVMPLGWSEHPDRLKVGYAAAIDEQYA